MSTYAVRSTGAWDLYRDEVRAGLRAHGVPSDVLCRAALCDANGLDALDDGLLSLAVMWFDESAGHLLRGAAKAA